MSSHPFNGRSVKQVGVVFKRGLYFIPVLRDRESYIELRAALLNGESAELQLSNLKRGAQIAE